MALKHLRTIRLVVSIVFFVATGILFLDLGGVVPPVVNNLLLSLQFLPSLLKVFITVASLSLGLLFVVLLTAMYGRVYCSSVCPLGTFQDLFIAMFRRIKGPRRFRFKRSPSALQYSLMGLTMMLGVAGSLSLTNVLDPFSNFGRILANLVRPAIVVLNNLAVSALNRIQFYGLYPIPEREFNAELVLFSVLFLLLLVYLCRDHGRLFCNMLCPVGGVLRLISKFSLYRLVIDEKGCRDCGLCEKVCKANCIDSKNQIINFETCVACFNCIDSCPTLGVVYEPRFWRSDSEKATAVNATRRKVLLGSIAALAAVAGGTVNADTADTTRISMARKKGPITPPGSLGFEHFTRWCTACHLCVSACPTQVIVPSFLEYGVRGVFQPQLKFTTSYCKYECNICSQICPSGAILPVDLLAKKQIQVGKSVFVKEDCIVITKKTECGACSEHCPTKAVSMVQDKGLFLPQLNNDICVGCGACEKACPTKPRKAIFVETNPVHLQAKKPEIKKLEKEVEAGTDFPF
jgi:ferredoxin